MIACSAVSSTNGIQFCLPSIRIEQYAVAVAKKKKKMKEWDVEKKTDEKNEGTKRGGRESLTTRERLAMRRFHYAIYPVTDPSVISNSFGWHEQLCSHRHY